MKQTKCITCGNRAANVTVAGNLGLSLLKIFAGIFAGSHALIADGFHSALDVIASLVTMLSLKISGKGPDRNHPYGHGKVEFIAASLVTAVLIIAIVFLFKDAIDKMNAVVGPRPGIVAVFVSVFSIIGSALLFRLNHCAGQELKSPALIAIASVCRADIYTSSVVVVGILGAMAGISWFDPVAVMIVGVVIIKAFVEIMFKSYEGLMDANFTGDIKQKVAAATKNIQGITRLLAVKVRWLGQRYWIDLRIEIPAGLTVSECYKITEKIKEIIMFRIENVEDVQIETVSEAEET